MPSYEAHVYDLDGTLVRLAVDWSVVRTEVANALVECGLEVDDESLWELVELSDRTGHRDVVESTISSHERAGARDSERLPAGDALAADDWNGPVGVCSLNCESACRLALEVHGLAEAVQAVIGRDSVDGEKPDPGPLLATVEALDVAPERTLFVGDSPRDEQTAERAGVPFRYVDDG